MSARKPKLMRATKAAGYYHSIALDCYVHMSAQVYKCRGEAHTPGNGHIDACAICAPYAWGYVLRVKDAGAQ